MKPFRGLERYLLTPVGDGGGAIGPSYPINVGGCGLVKHPGVQLLVAKGCQPS